MLPRTFRQNHICHSFKTIWDLWFNIKSALNKISNDKKFDLIPVYQFSGRYAIVKFVCNFNWFEFRKKFHKFQVNLYTIWHANIFALIVGKLVINNFLIDSNISQFRKRNFWIADFTKFQKSIWWFIFAIKFSG